MTLTFILGSGKLFLQFTFPSWIFVVSFIEISPLCEDLFRYANNFLWPRHDFDLWPLTFKAFLAMATHMMRICDNFHWNPLTKYRYISLRAIGVNEQQSDRRPDRPRVLMPLVAARQNGRATITQICQWGHTQTPGSQNAAAAIRVCSQPRLCRRCLVPYCEMLHVFKPAPYNQSVFSNDHSDDEWSRW